MIEYLTHRSFDKFGDIEDGDFSQACIKARFENLAIAHLDVTSQSLNTVMSINGSCSIISPMDGLSLLCVLEDTTTEIIRFFLIDKTISIHPGISFNIVPLYGSCALLLGRDKGSLISEYTLQSVITPFGPYPKLEINKVYTIFYQEKEKGFIFKGEKHNFWELTYVDKGVLNNIVDDKKYVIKEHELILYSENQNHIQWSDEESSVSFITVTFDMKFEDTKYLSDKIFSIDDELVSLLKRIISENNINSYYSQELIICYLKEFIIKLIRNDRFEMTIHNLDINIKNKIEDSITSKSTKYISQNIGAKLSVADIAKNVHVSQSYLSTLFKKNMNMTIIDYINKYRMDKSKVLIKTTGHNFTEIADMLGFTSIHYFSRQFKAYFGITPSEYAKQVK